MNATDGTNGAIHGQKTIFMTGATGHVGSVATELAIAEGYNVRGLSRAEKGDDKLKALGATPVRGDLHAVDVLRAEAAKADIVFHLADSFLDQANPKEYDEVIKIDGAAVDALAEPLKGTDKPLLVASGTLVTKADPNGNETTEASPVDPEPFMERIRAERHALSYADRGVRVIAIRLAPYVYGRGGSGVYAFLSMAFQTKQAMYIDDGHWKTSTVHVDDAARLFLLAAKHGKAGDVFNATNQTDITSRQLAETIAAAVNVPAVSFTAEQAESAMGSFMPKFLTAENRASNHKAVSTLGWKPREPGLIEELNTGSYHQAAKQLMANSA